MRPNLDTVDLLEQEPLDIEGSFHHVKQRKIAGFSGDECLVYIRQETVVLWTAIENAVAAGQNPNISGPPGT